MTAHARSADDRARADVHILADLHGVVQRLALGDTVRRMQHSAGADDRVAADSDGGARVVLWVGQGGGRTDQVAAQTGLGLHDHTTGKRNVLSTLDLGFS